MKAVVVVALLAACGSRRATQPAQEPVPATPDAMVPIDAPPVALAVADAAPAATDKLATEKAAFEKAKPVFDRYCAKCHTKSGEKATAKKLEHFDMTSYPFGGHHTSTLGPTMRKVLGLSGAKPTMPSDKKGAVQGDELALVKAWIDAWDAAHPGAGAGHHHH